MRLCQHSLPSNPAEPSVAAVSHQYLETEINQKSQNCAKYNNNKNYENLKKKKEKKV